MRIVCLRWVRSSCFVDKSRNFCHRKIFVIVRRAAGDGSSQGEGPRNANAGEMRRLEEASATGREIDNVSLVQADSSHAADDQVYLGLIFRKGLHLHCWVATFSLPFVALSKATAI